MRCTWMDPLLTNWFIRECCQMSSCHNVWGIGALKLFPESEWLGHSLKEKELVKKLKVVLIPLEAQPKGSQSDTWLGSHAVLWLFKIPKQRSQWDGSVVRVPAATPDNLSSTPLIHTVKREKPLLRADLWPLSSDLYTCSLACAQYTHNANECNIKTPK